MSIVISDASCLILFTNIDRLDILKDIFLEIWVTSKVANEYGLPLPPFFTVRDPSESSREQSLLLELDSGEASSIALALETDGCRIIIDEKKGRRIAFSLGLDVTGTIGILLDASAKGLIFPDHHLLSALDQCGFRVSDRLKHLLVSGA